jgi:hypothetical protein
MVIQWTYYFRHSPASWDFPNLVSKTWSVIIIRYEDSATTDCIQRATTMLESRRIQAIVRCHFPQLLTPKQSSVQEQHMSAVAVCGTNSLCAPGCVIKTHIQEEVFAKLSITCSHHKYKYNKLPTCHYMHTLQPDSCSHQADFCHWIVTRARV